MDIVLLKKHQSDKLIFFGVLLVFLGLVVGVFIPMIPNPRMALSSHLEGITNGFFLIMLGLIWNRLDLSGRWLSVIYWLSLYGTYATLIGVLLAAIFNSGSLMPIAGGKVGPPIIDGIVSFLVISLAIGMLVFCIVIMNGLYRHMQSNKDNESH